jgi:putative ABC transport system permease protein
VISKWYEKEEKAEKIVKYFTLLTIIISAMGLFALSIYYVQQRTKEIGIRKVNGAKTFGIIVSLNKEFVKWVLIAYAFSIPIAWYAMTKWLENFAYKIELSWWTFALAGGISILIAILTVSWPTLKAAWHNPVEALRYE